MANKVFAIPRKKIIKVSYEGIQNQIFHNFSTLIKAKQYDMNLY